MKKPMIAGLVTADDDYKDYCKAFEELGQEPFISLNLQNLDLADALFCQARTGYEPKALGQRGSML